MKLTRTVAAAVAGLAMMAAAAVPAAANSTPTVDRAEYAAVHLGDSFAKVKRVFDASGTIVSSAGGSQVRQFKAATNAKGYVRVTLKRSGGVYKVTAKQAVWLDAKYNAGHISRAEAYWRGLVEGSTTLAQARAKVGSAGTVKVLGMENGIPGIMVTWPADCGGSWSMGFQQIDGVWLYNGAGGNARFCA
ncbi:hypothetical protein [Demequina soli]|uniref:hypothetical protein n=1 Tax=Demequina soli TaxID=1638987 RepID=UPI000785AF31|nr:hypothetical protein [Demequina soli]